MHSTAPPAGQSTRLDSTSTQSTRRPPVDSFALDRAESHLQETTVVWDERLSRWRSHEEQQRQEERTAGEVAASRELSIGGEAGLDGASLQGTTATPTRAPSVVEGEEGKVSEEKREGKGGNGVTGGLGKKKSFEVPEKVPTRMTVDGRTAREVIWIEFSENDEENPFNWSKRKKWTTTIIACVFTMLVAYSSTAFSSGTAKMMVEIGCSREVATVALSAYLIGFAAAPLLFAPLSEAYGRYPVYFVSSITYLLFFIPIGLGQNIQTIIIGRFIAGVAGSTGGTLVGGTVSDLFTAHERGLPMAIYSVGAFLGTGLGPAISGWVALEAGWRWVQWHQMIWCGVLTVAIIAFTRETRGSIILSRRAKRLRKQTGDGRYQCRADAEKANLAVLIKVSLTRPLYLLCTEATVFFFTLWASFCWGSLYLLVAAIPLIFGNVYGFNQGEIGSTFFVVVLSTVFGFALSVWQNRMYARNVAKRGAEARLYACMIAGLVYPVGAFILAFSQGRGSPAGPIVGMGLIFFSVFNIYLAVFSYLADCYTIYASSAISGMSFARNGCGGVFPLFTYYLYTGIGYQWASFLAGCIALVLAVIPFVLFRYGPAIRARSKFAQELERIREEKEREMELEKR